MAGKGRFTKGNQEWKLRENNVIPVREFRWDVRKICEAMGFNPFERLIEMALTAKSEADKIKALTELCNYVAPKLKSIELKGDQQSPFTFFLNMWQQKGNNEPKPDSV